MKLRIVIIFCVIAFFSACVKDKPQPAAVADVTLSSDKKVYIVNEGNFNAGNASISLYDTGNHSVVEDFYNTQNNTALGDVAQSITKINNEIYIVINNSNKIVVCDQSFKIKRTIGGLTSPRYIQQISNQKAYVSDLYANAISIIDLNSGTKTGSIPCPGKTEQMVMLYNKVYVTNTEKNYLYVINAVTDAIIDSVVIGLNASSIVIDKNDKIWVLVSGKAGSTDGMLSRIDPNNLPAIVGVSFGPGIHPHHLCINSSKDTLFYINEGISYAPVADVYKKVDDFIPKGNKNFYGLGIHPTTHDIYACDVLDYIQKSNVYIYNSSTGAERRHFKTGFISNGFYFE